MPLHPFAQLFAELLGIRIRWTGDRLGSRGTETIVLGETPDPQTAGRVVLACNDDDGDTTAISLDRKQAGALRDALTEWINDR